MENEKRPIKHLDYIIVHTNKKFISKVCINLTEIGYSLSCRVFPGIACEYRIDEQQSILSSSISIWMIL